MDNVNAVNMVVMVAEIVEEISQEIEEDEESLSISRKIREPRHEINSNFSLIKKRVCGLHKIRSHITSQSCPGWKKFGWICQKCAKYHPNWNGEYPFNCSRCSTKNSTWICGCIKTSKNKMSQYLINKRINVYWPRYKSWYKGIVTRESDPMDGGTHDVKYDDDVFPDEISEKLIGDEREKWYFL